MRVRYLNPDHPGWDQALLAITTGAGYLTKVLNKKGIPAWAPGIIRDIIVDQIRGGQSTDKPTLQVVTVGPYLIGFQIVPGPFWMPDSAIMSECFVYLWRVVDEGEELPSALRTLMLWAQNTLGLDGASFGTIAHRIPGTYSMALQEAGLKPVSQEHFISFHQE